MESMLEAEIDEHLGYEPYERIDNENSRNGKMLDYVREGDTLYIKSISRLARNTKTLEWQCVNLLKITEQELKK